MKIVCISDTHCHDLEKLNLPCGDVLLHAGDWTLSGNIPEISQFNEYCGKILHKYTHGIYVTAGNHDFLAQHSYNLCSDILSNCNLLIDNFVIINNIKFYFSPWQPWFFNWAFNLYEEELLEKWKLIPEDTDILITHGPVKYILDLVPRGQNAGCGALLNRIKTLETLKVHVCGHIHYSYNYEYHYNKLFINASICNEAYQPVNAPIVFDINTSTKEIIIL